MDMDHRSRAALLFVAVGALAGCTREVTQPPTLVADETNAVFDTVTGRPGSTRELTFTNAGGDVTPALTTELLGDIDAFHVVADGCEGLHLVAGKSCSVTVQLQQPDAGSYQGELHVFGGPLGGSSVLLAGKVAPAKLTLSAGSADAGDVLQGAGPSPPLTFTVENVGGATSGALQIAVTAPFIVDDACTGKTLAGGEKCTLHARHPGAALDAPVGAVTGTLDVVGDPGGALSSPLTATVRSTGTLTATSIELGTFALRVNYYRDLTITNPNSIESGPLSLALQPDATNPTSTYPQFFIEGDSCSGRSLAAGASCTVSVLTHATAAAGTYGATVAVTAPRLHGVAARVHGAAASMSYELQLHFAGTGKGSVDLTADHDAQSWSQDVSFPLANGEQASVHARPAPGSVFTGWSGWCPATSGDCTFTGPNDGTAAITATFDLAH